jgi:predicted DNA-binding transcriptional regulator YafY
MLETSARLLRLLSLLPAPGDWTGAELARRLEGTTRTVRADIERLRSLGHPVHATRGSAGGYRLGAGAAMPPLLLDDEEAVAVTVGLRTTVSGAIAGIEETSVRAGAGAAVPAPAPGERAAGVHGSGPAERATRFRGGEHADRHRRRLPRPPAAPVRLPRPRRRCQPPRR